MVSGQPFKDDTVRRVIRLYLRKTSLVVISKRTGVSESAAKAMGEMQTGVCKEDLAGGEEDPRG